MVSIGESVQDISLSAFADGEQKTVKLADLQGKWVVLFFFPKAGSSICESEVVAFNALADKFEAADAQLIGISVDPIEESEKWSKKLEVTFPLASDASKEVAGSLDILNARGTANRATFIIDPEGIVRFQSVQEPLIARSPHEILRILQATQSGEFCLVGWTPN